MKTIKLIFGILVIASVTLIYTGCKKNDATSNQTDSDVTYANDDALAEGAFGEVKDIVDEAMTGQLKSTTSDTIFMGPCVVVTIDTLAFPHTITVDFGPDNCLCNDGRFRRGKILTHYTGFYWQVGTVITHTFDDYFVNNHQLLGTKIVTNQGLNGAGHPTWSIHVDGQIIKPNNGGTITWVADRVREWSEGFGTIPWWDDVYLITGTTNGIRANGQAYTTTILEAIQKALNCYWIEAGVVRIEPEGHPVRILNYGDGTCDNVATVTINGNTFIIYL